MNLSPLTGYSIHFIRILGLFYIANQKNVIRSSI